MTAGPDQAPRRALARTFASLSGHNYRLWVGGQSISLVGTWMQSIAQSWLVYELTGSAAVLGTVVAVQTVPTLLLGPYAGVWVDRLDRRRLMIGLQTMMGLQAAALAVLTLTGTVALWHVYVLAAVLGLNKAVENPARQTFVHELVGPDDLRNAVTLNSVLVNAARAVGPAVAGLVIVAGGTGICFAVNAVSFVAVVTSLLRLDTSALVPTAPAPRAPGQLREGLAHVRDNPELRVPLVMMALIGCLAYEFPVVASQTFGGDASTYGWLTGAMGVGAVVGGLVVAGNGRTGVPMLVRTALLFGLVMGLAAIAPSLWVALVAMGLVGMASVAFMAGGNSTLQLASAPHMRGRVMALWSVAFLGSTPIGGPIAGWVSEQWGGRGGLALGAVACLVAAAIGLPTARRAARAEAAS
ncbi:putative transporter [Pseudonocardia sp. Ae406_Ps2]|uniref:MFS transporter n=1 Tax=unclassified Pseudonocardia TaxID=2619320 RepID=UPI00094B69F8|nr:MULTISPECIES: MFS transporter [unclassified Pseudonocardia]OLM01042.1 putative transporter [Pseudonocardia sp. Ae406_Ps2]OLM07163.1 putative transporter [Pseudonocardia sp. Ae331_Ps2]OLM22620.1 putative transporter [Pseudonocardia sp. Ae706_Ps2]